MELTEAKITILIGSDVTRIELQDSLSCTTFARIELTPEQLSRALSRVSYTDCKITVAGLEHLNKKMENKDFLFEINEASKDAPNSLHQRCLKALKEQGMEEWQPDNYYNSQNTFSQSNGKKYAKTIIRRWVNQ